MSRKLRRYEVLFPLRLNDGAKTPDEWIASAIRELVAQFGACSYETQTIEGQWRHEDMVYQDQLARLFVDVPDTPISRKWMRAFRDRWKTRLKQLELWMVSYAIDIE